MNDIPLFVGKNCDAFKKFYEDDKQFAGMKDGRIPSLITIKNGEYKGRVIAAADKASCGADWGYIEIAVRLSSDDGKSFSDMKTIFTPPVRKYPFDGEEYTSAFAIDPLMMESEEGKLIMLMDFYPECKGLHAPKYLEKGNGYVKCGNEYRLKLYSGKTRLDGLFVRRGKEFTLHSDGFVYDADNVKTRYYIPHKHSSEYNYSTFGDMYYCVGEKPQYIDSEPPLIPEYSEDKDIYVGNIYVSKGKKVLSDGIPQFVEKKKVYDDNGNFLCVETLPAPFRAPMLSYIFMMESSDGGETFTQPVDITPYYKKDSDGIFVGVGPGIGITLKSEKYIGRILAPCYKLNSALVLISDDEGKTWRRNSGQFCENIDECQLVEMPDGKVFCFGRPKGGGNIPLSVSDDGGDTFRKLPPVPPKVPQCQRSVISVPPEMPLPDGLTNDGRYILLAAPTGHSGKDSTRTDGKVFLGRIDGEKVSWVKEYQITDKNKYASFEKYADFYAYSCLSILDDMTIGLLYEAYPSGYMTFAKFEL
ncbi:MAG: exo-alpha-sialidase [Ruminococcaceae bacterium]|nr:exo-alpha-sialidase [Oscillospiraceae bacterium]